MMARNTSRLATTPTSRFSSTTGNQRYAVSTNSIDVDGLNLIVHVITDTPPALSVVASHDDRLQELTLG